MTVSLQELYREVILDHYRNPRNRAPLTKPELSAEGNNPLCGDEVRVEVALEGGRVTAVSVAGHGCSISQSSASMMGEAIKGRTVPEVRELTARFKAMMEVEPDADPGLDSSRPGSVLGDLEALAGVRKFPVRIKCANLAWNTLEQALNSSS